MAGLAPTQQVFINFIFGLIVGAVVTFVGLNFSKSDGSQWPVNVVGRNNSLSALIIADDPHGNTHAEVDGKNAVSETETLHFSSHMDYHMLGEDALSSWMSKHIRILCWVMTSPQNLQEKAVHIKATWAKRCNKVLYISSENTDFPTLAVVSHEGREYLWQKTRGAFQHIYNHHLEEADWFLKADDDTYVIVENLRKLVSGYSPNQPIYFGRKFKPCVKQGFMSGGAGYILSRKAVELLVEKGFSDSRLCKPASEIGGAEDVDIGMCLMNVGVVAGDSRTGEYETFHPFVPMQMVVPNIMPRKFWYWSFNYYPAKEGLECCSDYSVSFHYVGPNLMYQLEYMIYHMRPFGIGFYTCPAEIRSIIGLPEVIPPGVKERDTAGDNASENKETDAKEDEKKGEKEEMDVDPDLNKNKEDKADGKDEEDHSIAVKKTS